MENKKSTINEIKALCFDISDATLTILVHNLRSLSWHVCDTVSDDRIMNDIGFTEAQISLSNSTCKIIKTLNFSSIKISNNKSLGYWCTNDNVVLGKLNANGVSTFSFTLMLVSL